MPLRLPEVVLAKKDGTLRMSVYWQLNQMTIKDAFPPPRIDEIFTSRDNAYCFDQCDLIMGYHQMAVREEDRKKIAFITQKGLYLFNLMPYRLCNEPATFQRLMEGNFLYQIGRDPAAYLDDLLMYALRLSELLRILHRTLVKLIDADKKCKPRKCHLFLDSIPYLQHIMKEWQIATDHSKL